MHVNIKFLKKTKERHRGRSLQNHVDVFRNDISETVIIIAAC
jgi:hypothetical protein